MADEDDYRIWKKRKDSWWTKISKQVKPIHVIGIAFLIFLGNYWTSTGKIQPQFFFGIIIAFGVLFFFLIKRETELKLIPEHIIKEIAKEVLEEKRRKGDEISFDCKVKPTLVGECKYEQDLISGTSGIVSRDVGFEIIKKGYKKKGVLRIHPYNGTVMGIRWMPLGYTGAETKDIKLVPIEVLGRNKI